MELTSRIANQDGEIVDAERGFKQCGVTVISNDPVIVLPSEQGLFVCRKTRGIGKRFPNPSDFLFGAQERGPLGVHGFHSYFLFSPSSGARMGSAPFALFLRVIRAPVFGRAYSAAPTLFHADHYGILRKLEGE